MLCTWTDRLIMAAENHNEWRLHETQTTRPYLAGASHAVAAFSGTHVRLGSR